MKDNNEKYGYYAQAVAFLKSKNHSAAIDYCERALALDRNFEDVWGVLGCVYDELGDYVRALECWNKVEIPSFHTAILTRKERAQQMFDDENLFSHYNNAYYSLKYGEYVDAMESCDIYLKDEPTNAEMWTVKAGAYLGLKQYAFSLHACVQALQYGQEHERVVQISDEVYRALKAEEMLLHKKRELRSQADKYFGEKNYQGTLICLGQLLDHVSPSEAKHINSEIAEVLVLKAFVLQRQGESEASINCFTNALLFNPMHTGALQRGDKSIIAQHEHVGKYDDGEAPPKKMKVGDASNLTSEDSSAESQQSFRCSPRK